MNFLPQVQASVQGVAPHRRRPRGAGAGRLPRRQLARPRLQLLPRHAQRRRRLLLHRGDVLQECPLPEGTDTEALGYLVPILGILARSTSY